MSLRESERAPRRARSHCCCLLRQSLCFQAHRRSSLARSLARTLSVKRNVTVNRNESSARKRESACACVCLLSQPLADADVDCAARVQLDFFQSWLGNRNRNNWNSSRRKFACVASISRAQQSQPTHPTPPHAYFTSHHTRCFQVKCGKVALSLCCSALLSARCQQPDSLAVAVSAGAGVSLCVRLPRLFHKESLPLPLPLSLSQAAAAHGRD